MLYFKDLKPKKGETMKGKKGLTIGDAPALVLTFAVVVIIASLIGTTLDSLQGTQTAGDADYNITGYGLTGTLSFAQLLPTVGVIIGIVMVLVVIFMLWNPTGGGMGV